MSVGSNLQEMENVVTKGAAAADPMPKMADPGTQLGNVEDLGGPSPENYRPDDDSAKLKDAGAILAQVRDVVNKGAKPAEAMPAMAKEEEEVEGDVVAEEENVSEEETTDEEVVEEETVEEEESIDVEEDVNALLEGEELSEEFQEKARTIFEAAIRTKIAEVKKEVEDQYESALIEEVVTIKEQLTDRVDAYLEYVADEWMQENQLAIEHGLKTEMTESFLTGMKDLFEEHYVSIPEDKYDVLESMVEKLDDMETKLNEQIERNIGLNKRLSESVSDNILDQVSEGLASTQKEKLASLAESVEFESEETYREKLETLKESYFTSKPQTPQAKTETLSEGTDVSGVDYTGSIGRYMKTLDSFGLGNNS